MDEKIASPTTLRTAADYKVAIDQCLTEMDRLQQQMRNDQAEIERLKGETRALLARMKAA